jgi:uncharacterized membrane protein
VRGRAGLVFAILLVLTAMTVFATSDALPPAVAAHFGTNDLANGWMSRDRYLVFMLCFCVGLPLALVAALGWLPRRPALRTHAYRLGILMLLLALGVHLLVLEANAARPPRLASGLLGALLLAFLAALALWVMGLVRGLRKA